MPPSRFSRPEPVYARVKDLGREKNTRMKPVASAQVSVGMGILPDIARGTLIHLIHENTLGSQPPPHPEPMAHQLCSTTHLREPCPMPSPNVAHWRLAPLQSCPRRRVLPAILAILAICLFRIAQGPCQLPRAVGRRHLPLREVLAVVGLDVQRVVPAGRDLFFVGEGSKRHITPA